MTDPESRPRSGSRNSKKQPQQTVSAEAALLMEISQKLDRVIAVLAVQGKDREKQIDILSAVGCDSAFIGNVVGLTASAVRGVQSRRRDRARVKPSDETTTEE